MVIFLSYGPLEEAGLVSGFGSDFKNSYSKLLLLFAEAISKVFDT